MIEIPFEGNLTKDEFLSVSRLARRPMAKNRNTIVFDVWVALIVIGSMLVAIGVWQATMAWRQARADQSTVSWLVVFAIGVTALVIGIKAQGLSRKLWEQNEAVRARRHGKITGQGVEVYTPFGQTRLRWADLTGYGECNEILVLFQGTSMAIPFPRHFFAGDEEWQQFRTAVTGRLTVTHQATKVSVSIAQIPVYVLILIAIVALLVRACRQ